MCHLEQVTMQCSGKWCGDMITIVVQKEVVWGLDHCSRIPR